MEYSTDRKWSDQYIPLMKKIIGPYLLETTPNIVDMREAADLIVLNARGVTIACRIRRPGFFLKYGNEFTIRSNRDSGAATELEKITNGFGDWMFYGHAGDDGIAIPYWHLIDLNAWRAHMIRNKEKVMCGEKSNGDGTYFAWFDLMSFPDNPPILIASSTIPNALSPFRALT